MIYALETKAASVAKRMSTAMFVHNDIRSKYTGFLLNSVDCAVKYIILLDIYFGNIHVQESFTVCMCDKISVSVCAYNKCVQHMFVCVCVCVSIMLLNTIDTTKNPVKYLFGTYMCRIPLQFACVIKLVCLCVFVHII